MNTTAEVKAESDYCCTSGNAVEVVNSIPADQRDSLSARHVPRRARAPASRGAQNMHVWMGECHVHAGIDPENIRLQRSLHPEAEFLIHPECGCSTSVLEAMSAGDVDPQRRADPVDRRDDQAPGALRRRRVHRRDRGRHPASTASRESKQALLCGERAGVVRLHEGHDAAQGPRFTSVPTAPNHGRPGRGCPGARAIERMVAIGGGATQPLSPAANGVDPGE